MEEKAMTCPKCGAEPKEFWYDGSCIEHGRPEPVEGRWYYVKADSGSGEKWHDKPIQGFFLPPHSGSTRWPAIAWLPIPTVEELLLTTKGKV